MSWHDMEKHYRILGLSRGATTEAEITRAYRQKALLYHPDRNPNGGEAFKALREAYEMSLIDVKRGSSSGFHGCMRDTAGPSRPSYAYGFSTAAGAAHNYARAPNSTRGTTNDNHNGTSSSSSPFFSEAELFGDAIPGGWRDVGSQQRKAYQAEKPFSYQGSGNGESTTSNSAASPTDVRWRRAHGRRVPVSAYEGSCPVPPPPPPSTSTSTQPSFPSARSSDTTPASNITQQQQQSQASSTQAQWEAFLAQGHPWRTSSPPHETAENSSEKETAEEHAYREAMFLHRRVQELNKQDEATSMDANPSSSQQHTTTPSLSSKSATSHRTSAPNNIAADRKEKEELYRQWQGIQASLQRKLHRQDETSPRKPDGADKSEKDNDVEKSDDKHHADTSASGVPSSPSRTFNVPISSQRSNAHQESIMRERRLLQREYLRYRYTPDPADVGEMTDMEVYLLAELLGEIHGKVQAVLSARLLKGPCSACGAQPRDTSRLYFACTHASVCAACFEMGVLSCPLCGAARATTEDNKMDNPEKER